MKGVVKTSEVEEQKLVYERFFTKKGVNPFDLLEWEFRDAKISDSNGKTVFEQKNIEVPVSWSQTATNIAVSKYFRGQLGTDHRETSIKQMITRVAHTITTWGREGNYFSSEEEAQIFEDELTYILVAQYAAFNSPVWFNMGVDPHPQSSACFINSVRDDMRSILETCVTEGMIFKGGSGSGINFSTLRSSKESLQYSSGKASGPVSFMKGLDTFAGAIKSGGKTRRAAKMCILNVTHPDIMEFVNCKAVEEKKAWALIEAGYDASYTGEAYGSIQFQNANHSVRVTDEFMNAFENNGTYETKFVTNGKTCEVLQAADVMKGIAESAYLCGDPGIQFDDTINKWNPVSVSGRVNSSNPCSEFMHLDDTACNLASLNLMKYRDAEGKFDVEAYKHAIKIIISAQEMLVSNSSYPTAAITQNSFDFRPLGIGYANLGALLMSKGLAYDSEEGRNCAAALTSILSGYAYEISSLIASKLGAFTYFETNREPFLKVIGMHREAAYNLKGDGVPEDVFEEAQKVWDNTLAYGEKYGYKNAQISVLAPTGTIGFLMDCDTTGVEPDIALVKYKWLVGGGMIKIVNNTVPEALMNLGYSETERKAILNYLQENDTIEGAPFIKEEHLSVFDCAFKPAKGKRSIHYLGHLRMMGAVQPFISGAISKTVNMPNEVTSQDIMDTYVYAWKLGIKAVAIYRDGCKRSQPLTTSLNKVEKKGESQVMELKVPVAQRKRMPADRQSLTHKFEVGGMEGYLIVGLYEDGSPGELFLEVSRQGSTLNGFMDSFATSVSIALQYGIPLKVLVRKFMHSKFEPAGITKNKQIRFASSILDYVSRYLALKFLTPQELQEIGLYDGSKQETLKPLVNNNGDDLLGKNEKTTEKLGEPTVHQVSDTFQQQSDAPMCTTCGNMMVRSAACYKCFNCGTTSGCS